jgi:hypothetical protein
MRSAAARGLFFLVLAIGGIWSGAATAGGLDPIGTVTSAVSTIIGQTTVVSDLAGGVTSESSATSAASGATDAVGSVSDPVISSALPTSSGSQDSPSSGDSSSSGGTGGTGSGASRSDSGSAAASNRGSPRTRFDRLPRRYETLLERIESGRHVAANVARLRALLASASPEFRARIMRLIRLEIRRLERGRMTPRERAAARRLRHLLTALAPAPRPAPRGSVSLGRAEAQGILSSEESFPTASVTKGSRPFAGGQSNRGPDDSGIPTPRVPLPAPPSPAPPYWPLFVLAALAVLLLLLSSTRRQLLPAPVRGMAELRRPAVFAVATAVGLGLVAGLLVVLIQRALL